MKRALVLLALIAALASLAWGPGGFARPESWIFWQLRIPRTLLALVVGAGLGTTGAALQGALRNPLADSGLLGIGASASLGAVIVFYWGVSRIFPPALPLGGLAGAALGLGFLFLLVGRELSGLKLILAGVALSALCSALLALALVLAPNPYALAEITFWLMGGLADRSLLHVALAAPPILLGLWILAGSGAGLDALSLGEDTAASLGHPAPATLKRIALGSFLIVGPATAVAGGIGFVGLVVPHVIRHFLGSRPGGLLIPSALGGALLLTLADLVTRMVPFTSEPPIGVLTALIGAPFLVVLLRRPAR
jgi:iron complex transport system permease protein